MGKKYIWLIWFCFSVFFILETVLHAAAWQPPRGRLAARGRLEPLMWARGTSLELASKLQPFFDFFGFSDGLEYSKVSYSNKTWVASHEALLLRH